jgi:hypothetical protein
VRDATIGEARPLTVHPRCDRRARTTASLHSYPVPETPLWDSAHDSRNLDTDANFDEVVAFPGQRGAKIGDALANGCRDGARSGGNFKNAVARIGDADALGDRPRQMFADRTRQRSLATVAGRPFGELRVRFKDVRDRSLLA